MRTNPVTGWKSLFGAGHQIAAGWINGVTERESEILKDYCECDGQRARAGRIRDILVPALSCPLTPSLDVCTEVGLSVLT